MKSDGIPPSGGVEQRILLLASRGRSDAASIEAIAALIVAGVDRTVLVSLALHHRVTASLLQPFSQPLVRPLVPDDIAAALDGVISFDGVNEAVVAPYFNKRRIPDDFPFLPTYEVLHGRSVTDEQSALAWAIEDTERWGKDSASPADSLSGRLPAAGLRICAAGCAHAQHQGRLPPSFRARNRSMSRRGSLSPSGAGAR